MVVFLPSSSPFAQVKDIGHFADRSALTWSCLAPRRRRRWRFLFLTKPTNWHRRRSLRQRPGNARRLFRVLQRGKCGSGYALPYLAGNGSCGGLRF